ncbi:MAG: hypothetical protein WCP85_01185 [Mariniphaga sp.]
MERISDFSTKLDRNAQIIGVLSKYSIVWHNNTKFQHVYDQLVSNQVKLDELFVLFGKDLSTFDVEKNIRRKQLEEKVLTIVRIMQTFANDKMKMKLQQRLYHLNLEYIQNCTDDELIKIAKKNWLIANKFGGYALTFVNKIKASLNPDNLKNINKFEKRFGLNPEMIKNLEEALLRFIEAKVQYQVEVEEKEKLANKIKEINKQSKKLIFNKIDQFVLLVEIDQPDFYREYRNLIISLFSKNDDDISDINQDIKDIDQEQIGHKEPKPEHKKSGKEKAPNK